ncbi:MAG: response regulator [Bacilli bacterium]
MIKLAIVDDHPIVRTGLVSFLNATGAFQITCAVESSKPLFASLEEMQPQLLLMDVKLAHENGIQITRNVKNRYPSIKVFMLTSSENPSDVREAISAGADGYQLKEIAPTTIIENIHSILAGGTIIHPRMMTHLLKPASSVFLLTPREKEIVKYIANGKANKEIAASLHITEATVKTHVSNILQKLQLDDRTQIAIWALPQLDLL